MSRGNWKESLYRVYKALEESSKKGENEISLFKLSALSGFSPLYLRVHLLPMLIEVFPCIKYLRGKVFFNCTEEASGG